MHPYEKHFNLTYISISPEDLSLSLSLSLSGIARRLTTTERQREIRAWRALIKTRVSVR